MGGGDGEGVEEDAFYGPGSQPKQVEVGEGQSGLAYCSWRRRDLIIADNSELRRWDRRHVDMGGRELFRHEYPDEEEDKKDENTLLCKI